jgi:hypothetical protein
MQGRPFRPPLARSGCAPAVVRLAAGGVTCRFACCCRRRLVAAGLRVRRRPERDPKNHLVFTGAHYSGPWARPAWARPAFRSSPAASPAHPPAFTGAPPEPVRAPADLQIHLLMQGAHSLRRWPGRVAHRLSSASPPAPSPADSPAVAGGARLRPDCAPAVVRSVTRRIIWFLQAHCSVPGPGRLAHAPPSARRRHPHLQIPLHLLVRPPKPVRAPRSAGRGPGTAPTSAN